MYPHVIQFETREFQLRRRLQLVREREAQAAREAVRRSPQPLRIALRRQPVGGGLAQGCS